MRREAVVPLLLVLLALLPMWYVALQGEPPAEQVEIDQSVSDIRPLAEIIDTPEKLSPSQVGVIVWVALFGLVAVVAGAHRFMNQAVRPPDEQAARADGGESEPSWLVSGSRWIAEYQPASASVSGIVVMAALTVLAIVFAALFTGEYLTLARTQYFGLYAAGMFLALAGLTVAYYAWFMPHILVVERREH